MEDFLPYQAMEDQLVKVGKVCGIGAFSIPGVGAMWILPIKNLPKIL
jgi:hypothetical protein